MRNILKSFCVVASVGGALSLSACSPTTGIGVEQKPATSANGCMQQFAIGVVVASASSTSYNRGCAERAARTNMINSKDAGIAAVGLRASELAGDIPSQAIDEVVGQLNNPKSKACVVTGKRGNEVALSCGSPVIVAGGPNRNPG